MSGPKTSRYTLTPEQRRILAWQREMDRRKAIASDKIQRGSKKLVQIGSMFSSEKQVSAELVNRIGNDGGFLQKINGLEEMIVSLFPIVERTTFILNFINPLNGVGDFFQPFNGQNGVFLYL